MPYAQNSYVHKFQESVQGSGYPSNGWGTTATPDLDGVYDYFSGLGSVYIFSQSSEINAKSQQLEERQASMNAATQSLEQLKYEISRLQDPEYIGQIAMKKYGLYKPGEIPVRVSESSPEND